MMHHYYLKKSKYRIYTIICRYHNEVNHEDYLNFLVYYHYYEKKNRIKYIYNENDIDTYNENDIDIYNEVNYN